MNTKLGQEPVFPSVDEDVIIGQTSYTYIDTNGVAQIGFNNEKGRVIHNGISKRFYAACAAMQGILSSGVYARIAISDVIEKSYQYADELLKQENNEPI